MAQIRIELGTDAQTRRIVNAICRGGGYRGDPADQVAKLEFVRQAIIGNYILPTVRRVERGDAMAEIQLPAPPEIT